MISYNYETDFILPDELLFSDWLFRVCRSEGCELGEISYIFCDDEYLHKINVEYLDHDDYTDIISFDYSEGKILQGDIFISVERVAENAREYGVDFIEELRRVMVHGLLHYIGFKDKSAEDAALMREKENEKINMFHVERY